MSTLVKNIDEFKRYVSVNFNFDIALVMPDIRSKERQHIKPVLGSELYNTWATAAPATGRAQEVYLLMQEASANLAAFAFTFMGVVQMSNNGFHISQNQNTTPAEWWHIRDLRKKLVKSGTTAIDEALEIMEANESEFPTWITSNGYTNFKELFTRKTQTFQRYFNIENSRLTFLRLRPHLLKVEEKYFLGLLGQETVTKIKQAATDEAKEALAICQAAQVSLCVAEQAYEGAFLLTSKGLFAETEEIPGEKKTVMDPVNLHNLYQAKINDGNEMLKKLVRHLQKHSEIFTEFATKEVNATTSMAHNTKSTVSF